MRATVAVATLALAAAFALPARAGDVLDSAYALQHQHKWTQAEQAFRKAAAADPGATTEAALAQFLDLTGRYAEALGVAQKAMAAFPGDPEVVVAEAECLGDTNHYHASMALCRRELAKLGKSGKPEIRSQLYLILAGAQGTAAQKDGILAMFKYAFSVKKNIDKSLELDPTYARANYGAGMYYLEAPIGADPKKGLALLERAHRLDPDDYGIEVDLIDQLDKTGHKQRARQELAAFDQAFSGLAAARHDIAPIAARLR